MTAQRLSLLASLFSLLAAPAAAQCELQELHSSPGAAGEGYGAAIAIHGDLALVGVPAAERVDVYSRTAMGWQFVAELLPAPGQEGRFGAAVAISGTTAVVGAPFYSDGSFGAPRGAATVFELLPEGWAALEFLSPTAFGFFGQSVAIDPDGILAGAAADPGEAYYFDRDPAGTPGDPADDRWVLANTFTLPFPPAEHTMFGHAVALQGGTAVISAPGKDDASFPHNVHGVVLTSERVGDVWSPLKQVAASVPLFEEAPLLFGWSISLSGDRLVATSKSLVLFPQSGSAFLLERDRMGTSDPTDDVWVQQAYFDQRGPGGEPPPGDGFGASCSLDGARFLVGAPSYPYISPVEGAVHVFEQFGIGWLRTGRVNACPPTTGGRFGETVALQGPQVFAGEPGDDDLGVDAGAVHVFEFRSAQALTYARIQCGDPLFLFRSLAPPRIGAAWRTTVDLAAAGATASLVAVSLTGPTPSICAVLTAYGELAILPPFAVLDLAVGLHELAIPSACPFVGLPFWSQAATLGTAGIRLQNGIFGQIGTF